MTARSKGPGHPKAWAFDLDGVVWTGKSPIPGSADAIQRVIDAGQPVAFVTNNSSSTVASQEAKLKSFGIEAEGRVITSAMAGASLVQPGERAYVLGGPGVVEALKKGQSVVVSDLEARAEPPDAVVVGLDHQLSYERLSTAVLALRAGARFVATNTDSSYPSEVGLLPGGGAIVQAVAYSTDRQPVVAGKPNQAQADLVRDLIGDEGIMVGDRPETDGLFARTLGFDFGLVLSGVTQPEDLPIDPMPDYVAQDLAALMAELSG